MSPIIAVLCLIFLSAPTNSELIGIGCNKTDENLVLVSCEKLDIVGFTTTCPKYIESSCPNTEPCLCDSNEFDYETPCTAIWYCHWDNATVVTTTTTAAPDVPSNKSTKLVLIIAIIVTVIIIIAVTICIYRWKRICISVVTSSHNRFYATFHSNNDDSTIHCVSNDQIDNEDLA